MNIFKLTLVCLLFFSYSIPSAVAFSEEYTESSISREMIVYFQDANVLNEQVLVNYEATIIKKYPFLSAFLITIPLSNIDELEAEVSVLNVVENKKVEGLSDHSMELSNTSIQGGDFEDWGIAHSGIGQAWTNGYSGKGIKIGVFDSGIDTTHTDLRIAGGVSFINETHPDRYRYPSYHDFNGHGTHVAGTIGALKNDRGVIGVAYNSSIYAVKVFDETGSSDTSTLLAGIDWAIQQDMDIINLSLGGQTGYGDLELAFQAAYDRGMVVVAAAGNDDEVDNSGVDYPAVYSSTIAVAAIDQNDQKATFSSVGPEVDISAPGVMIASTYIGDQYAYLSGTSMATPYVSGFLALLKQKFPLATNQELQSMLVNSAVDLGTPGHDDYTGWGKIFWNEAKFTLGSSNGEVRNNAPTVSQQLENVVLNLNETIKMDLDPLFTDQDGDVLTYSFKLENHHIRASIIDKRYVSLTGVTAGGSYVDITASDGEYSVTGRFYVVVNNSKLVTSIAVSQEEVLLTEGETTVVSATVSPQDATDKNVTWASSHPEIVTVNQTGQLQAFQKGKATVMVRSTDGNAKKEVSVIVLKPGETFYDVPIDHRFKKEIDYLYNNEIIFGYNSYTFGPSDRVSRAAAATMIGRALGLSGEQRETEFPDVAKGNTASGYIQVAAELGIIQGFPDGTFRPNESVTRGQMAIFIARAFNLTKEAEVSFTDVPETAKSYTSIRRILAEGITQGYPGGLFKPDDSLTRSDFSALLSRTLNPAFRVN